MSHRSELPPEHLVAELVGLLDDAGEIDDPADLELLAGTLLLPISIPEVPEAARRVVVDAIAARADPIAAATLAALAVFAPAPLAAHAHEAAVLLAGRGVTHPSVADIGTLSVNSAAAGADDDTEMIVAVRARPGSRDRQVLVLGIDVANDALIECMLTPPLPRREAERLLRKPTDDASAPPLAALATDTLAARVMGPPLALAISVSRSARTPRRSCRSSPAPSPAPAMPSPGPRRSIRGRMTTTSCRSSTASSTLPS